MLPLQLPQMFNEFAEVGGVLEFGVFENAQGEREEVLEAIAATIAGIDKEALVRLGARQVDRSAFFGDWCDSETKLINRGRVTTADGRVLINPFLVDLEGLPIVTAGATPPPSPQFAYAFSMPPYGLKARQSEVQRLFSAISDFILPPQQPTQILDWSNPRLVEASAYFVDGAEWWGALLYTIELPALKRLVVVAGSATD
jgi:hypothetical protein